MIVIFWFKKHNNDFLINEWVLRLRQVQEDIKILEERKNKIDVPPFLPISDAVELSNQLFLIWNGRQDPCKIIEFSKNKDDIEFLKNFAYYLLSLCESADEYNSILDELKEKRSVEKVLKEKLSIK